LRQIKSLSFPKSTSFFQKMSSTAFDLQNLSVSLKSLENQQQQQQQHELSQIQEPVPTSISAQIPTGATLTSPIGNGIPTASGRPVEPRRIKSPIAVAPMVDVTTS
ncbi:hypothetical protein BGZ46_006751, partial [Entomortierella lignicola]